MIVLIAAMDPMGVIAVNGRIPWRIKADLKRFQIVTQGSTLVVGRKTWLTLPKLKYRQVVVLSRRPEKWYRAPSGEIRFLGGENGSHPPDRIGSPADAEELKALLLDVANTSFESVAFVAGGAEIYQQALDVGAVDAIDLTIVPPVKVEKGDSVTRFPPEYMPSSGNGTVWRYSHISQWVNDSDPRITHHWYENERILPV